MLMINYCLLIYISLIIKLGLISCLPILDLSPNEAKEPETNYCSGSLQKTEDVHLVGFTLSGQKVADSPMAASKRWAFREGVPPKNVEYTEGEEAKTCYNISVTDNQGRSLLLEAPPNIRNYPKCKTIHHIQGQNQKAKGIALHLWGAFFLYDRVASTTMYRNKVFTEGNIAAMIVNQTVHKAIFATGKHQYRHLNLTVSNKYWITKNNNSSEGEGCFGELAEKQLNNDTNCNQTGNQTTREDFHQVSESLVDSQSPGNTTSELTDTEGSAEDYEQSGTTFLPTDSQTLLSTNKPTNLAKSTTIRTTTSDQMLTNTVSEKGNMTSPEFSQTLPTTTTSNTSTQQQPSTMLEKTSSIATTAVTTTTLFTNVKSYDNKSNHEGLIKNESINTTTAKNQTNEHLEVNETTPVISKLNITTTTITGTTELTTTQKSTQNLIYYRKRRSLNWPEPNIVPFLTDFIYIDFDVTKLTDESEKSESDSSEEKVLSTSTTEPGEKKFILNAQHKSEKELFQLTAPSDDCDAELKIWSIQEDEMAAGLSWIPFFGPGVEGLFTSGLIKNQNNLVCRLRRLANQTAKSLELLLRTTTEERTYSLINRHAIDFLLSRWGGTCKVLGPECCIGVEDLSRNISEQIDQIRKDEQRETSGWGFGTQWWNSQWGMLTNVIILVVLFIAILIALSCICKIFRSYLT
nr:envelope glycoprotein [Dehong virus]